MTEFPILRDLGFVVLGAAGALLVGRPLRVPPVLAFICAGLVLGPATGVLEVSESIRLFSELGVALLLFLIGLELSLARIREVGRAALLGGVVQVASTFVLAAGLGWWLGLPPAGIVFLALAATFSSTAVVVKLLDRIGALDTTHGRISIGILLVQDVVVALVLTLVSGLGEAEGLPGAAPAGAAGSAVALLRAFLGLVVLAAGAAVAVRWVLRPLLRWLVTAPEALFVTSLAWAFLLILGAEAAHLSIELGAFVAGVALAQLPERVELSRRVHPLVDFFLAIFFVALGTGMDLGEAAPLWRHAVVFILFVSLVKPLLIGLTLRWSGHPGRTAFLAGLTLGQTSEFAFVLAALAIGAGLLPESYFSLIGVVGLATIGLSTILVPGGEGLFLALQRWGIESIVGTSPREEPAQPPRGGHVVVVGMNALGRRLVEGLRTMGERVLAVDTDPAKLAGLPVDTLVGSTDTPAVLEEAGVPAAKLVVSALQIEDANALLAHRCHELGVPVSIHAFEPTLGHELLDCGADHIMVSKLEGVRPMADELRRAGVRI